MQKQRVTALSPISCCVLHMWKTKFTSENCAKWRIANVKIVFSWLGAVVVHVGELSLLPVWLKCFKRLNSNLLAVINTFTSGNTAAEQSIISIMIFIHMFKQKYWTLDCCDSCDLMWRSRADEQGAAAGGPEMLDRCSPPRPPQPSLPPTAAGRRRNNSLDCSRRADNMTAQDRNMQNVQCSRLSVCSWGGGGCHSGAATCY